MRGYWITFNSGALSLRYFHAKNRNIEKLRKPPITRIVIRRNSEMTLAKALNDYNSGQFKPWMTKMAAQVYFQLYLIAVLSPGLFGDWRLAYICQIKVKLPYLRAEIIKYWSISVVRPFSCLPPRWSSVFQISGEEKHPIIFNPPIFR